jgi:hypothetical protein
LRKYGFNQQKRVVEITIKTKDIVTIGMSDNTVTASKQDENSSFVPESKSNPESKSAPFISSIWVLTAVLG